jgi:ABC-type uncharacterized transport system permease subunit
MDIEKLLSIIVIFVYSLGAFGIVLGTLSMRHTLKAAANRLTFGGFALHTILLVTVFFQREDMMSLSAGYFMQLLAWCLILFYLAAWRWLRLPFLGLTAAPLALLLTILSMRLSDVRDLLPEHFSALFFGLHIWALYLSIGLLTMAFGAGVLFIYSEGKLKKKAPLAGFTKDMPSLSTYDKVNNTAVIAGFPLYTLGLMSGFIWAPLAKEVVENPKVLLSLFIWMLYAVLFYQRTAMRYRGRKTAVMAIVIFLISVLSFGIDYTVSHHSSLLLP